MNAETTQTKALFPLRSNVGWYESALLRQQIGNSLKEALLVYDHVYVEDGTYRAAVFEHGSFDMHIPPGSVKRDRRITSDRESRQGPASLRVEDPKTPGQFLPILGGETIANFNIDFSTLFEGINLNSCPFIKLISYDKSAFPENVRGWVDKITALEKARVASGSDLFFRQLQIQNLNIDIAASLLLGSAVILDERHAQLLREKSSEGTQSAPSLEHVTVRELLSVAVPDFSALSVADVIELRFDPRWVDFRGEFSQLCARVRANPGIVTSPQEIRRQVRSHFAESLLREVEKRHGGERRLGIEVALGVTSLVPGAGIGTGLLSICHAVHTFKSERAGWLGFLMRLRANSRELN